MPADDLLRRLAARPALLWALAVLGNAVWMPHAGVVHDATLYAAQTLNAADGRLAGDLFFAYGSQSDYTVFPQLLARVVARVGVDWAFFLGYVASSASFVAGLVALLRRVIGATALLPLAVLWCACCPIPCGYANAFSVNEAFLTGRLPAGALGLFTLERALAGRWLAFAALTAAALAVHPLVAAPVALVGGACAVARSGRWGWPAVAAVTAAGLAVLAVPGLPVAVFGPMSAAWRGDVLAVMPFPDPANWAGADWLRLGLAAAVAIAFARLARGSPGATLAAASVLVAAVGVALAHYAANSEARLLFQGQAYRWVWPLEVLRAPLALAVAARLWPHASRAGRAGLVALLLLAAGFPTGEPRPAVAAAAVGAVVAAVALRRSGAAVARLAAVAAALVAGGLVESEASWQARPDSGRGVARELAARLHSWHLEASPLVRASALLALAFLGRAGLTHRGAAPALVAAAALWQLAFGEPARGDWARRDIYLLSPDNGFVADTLRARPPTGRRVSVYAAGVDPKFVWCDLDCDCYFMPAQVSGVPFSEAGAAETFRRARLTRPFDWLFLPDARGPGGAPTQADFDALAAEPGVDVLVLRQEFPGYAATNGRVFVYDLRCR